MKRHANQGEDQPFYFGKGVYVPIGQYLLLKNDKKDGKIQLYELGENPEIVGEQLSQSLVMLSKLGFTNAFSISSKVIGDHTIGGGKDCKSKINSLMTKLFRRLEIRFSKRVFKFQVNFGDLMSIQRN